MGAGVRGQGSGDEMEVLTPLLIFFIVPSQLSILQANALENKDANVLTEERDGMLVAGIVPHQWTQNISNTVPPGTLPPPSYQWPDLEALSTTVTPEEQKSISQVEDVLVEVKRSLDRYSEHVGPNAQVQSARKAADATATSALVESGEPDPTKVSEPFVKLQKIRSGKNMTIQNRKQNGRRRDVKKTNGTKKTKKTERFPYFLDNYCPPDCACYGRVVQCSDKAVDKIPYGIPYSSRYILLMNNRIDSIQLDLLRGYASMEFLVLSKNQLTDDSLEGAFQGIQALKRLYLDQNLLSSVPTDLPASLQELRLDNNRVRLMSQSSWARCPGLLVLSLSNNSLGDPSGSLLDAVLSPLHHLRTLNLDQNQLTTVPLWMPLSIKELYLRGNLIEYFSGRAFNGTSQLAILDLSTNRLSNKGLAKDALLNAPNLESLNLEGNRFKKVPQHLPSSLKSLNLEGNLISAIRRMDLNSLPNLEHLGLARNKISKVAPGAFRSLPVLHQLDLCYNALRQVPRQLPRGLHSLVLTHNRIESVPRDAFCWGRLGSGLSGLVRVQLGNNLMDMGKLDSKAFRCLRGFQVVHFY
ncbi:wu:fc23c09 [Syngnathoides biaculeatus]|uniref:wu:fc23c09 n=1 Tax=Syngnathoides biaculeatus TaxID=300417 RepID=UPI002ADD9749|nr:wu:fc23c09 [Syngnathoides biaculeatus]